jgi:long-chain acyl-CoA synthetase
MMTADGTTGELPRMSVDEAHHLLTQPGSMFEVGETEIRGVQTKIWKAALPTLREVFERSAAFGAREYLVYEEERVTFGQFRGAVLRLAAQLRADGVRPGERVALIMRNLPEWPVAFWAAILVGAIITPLNGWWTEPELEFALRDSGAAVVIADNERWDRINKRPTWRKAYVTRALGDIVDPRFERLENVLGAVRDWPNLASSPQPDYTPAPDDDVAIFYTSGTTGKPKGAVISHRNVISSMYNAASAQARAFLRRNERPPAPDLASQKIYLLSVPLFHVAGAFSMMMPTLFGGHKIVMQRRWDSGAALELIQRESVTLFGGVPTIVWQLLEHPRVDEFDLSSIQTVFYGGAPSAPELLRRLKQRFPRAVPTQGWGMTETSGNAFTNAAEEFLRKPASCGVPSAVGDVRIVDSDGTTLPCGEVGEIWYKGPSVARGYWNNPAATAEAFVDGWVKTGDIGRMDEERFMFIVDRTKDLLIRGGENIYCIEVENVLYEHPAVIDAAVIGRPHRTLGEEPLAILTLKLGADITVDQLRHHAAQKLAAFKVPVDIIFWPESLPRNASGKIDKTTLRSLIEARKPSSETES